MSQPRQLERIFEIDRRIRAGQYLHPDCLAVELEVSGPVIFNDRSFLVNLLRAPLECHKEYQGWFYFAPLVLPAAVVTQGEHICAIDYFA